MPTPTPDISGPPSTRNTGQIPGLLGLGLLIFALWMAIHPYLGIIHDGGLYTLLAMARLYPALGHDFFVLNGVQDHYTLFTPLYAAAIRLLGLDLAAALVVLATQAVFFCAAWRLARRLTSADKALLGLGLLVVLPSWYGANMALYHMEMFPTPREPAETFVLLGMGFALTSQHRAAAACLLAAALLHPIIAGAGILFWLVLEFALPHPRRASLVGLGCTALGVLVAMLPRSPLPHFDPDWLNDLVHRQTFLFPTLWSTLDWARVLPGLATLLAGACGARSPLLRRLCRASVVTVLLGLALAVIGGDLLHLALVTQMQMWRWLWLSGVLSALVLPVIVLDLWDTSMAGRAGALALVVCWLASQPSAFDWSHLATQLQATPATGSHFAARMGQLRTLASNAPLCAMLLILVWQAARSTKNGKALIALGITACVIMLPYSWATWTRAGYPQAAATQFESWRDLIPEDAEVLWPDSPPLALWYSLRRASWFSPVQMAGIVFSRREWETGQPRENAIMKYLPLLEGLIGGAPAKHGETPDPQWVVDGICHAGVGFFASWRDLGPSPYPVLTPVHPSTGRPALMRLYHCDVDP